MLKFEVFGKNGCAKCKSTKNKIAHVLLKTDRQADVAIDYFDLDSVGGMAEGAFNDVSEVPTTILRDDAGQALARWEGRLPPSVEMMAYLASGGGA
ncbi:MAG: hypothetical protein ISS74_06535 [Planctomycetes bacterium]|nr:hypothetical protein [Planctomycetota bacterium]